MVNVQTCYSDLDLILAQFIGSACAREEDSMESTRRIVMFNWMTANGYFAGADGNLDWVVPDEEQAKAAVDGIPLFDSVLFGRRTYELFEKFWNHAVDDSSTAPDPHHRLVSLVVVENRFFGIGAQIFLSQLPYNERSLNSQRLSIPPVTRLSAVKLV